MLRARRAYVRNGGDREPSPGLCSEPFERAPRPTRVWMTTNAKPYAMKVLNPDDRAVIAAIDLV